MCVFLLHSTSHVMILQKYYQNSSVHLQQIELELATQRALCSQLV